MLLRLLKVTKGARGILFAKSCLGLLITATYVAQAILLARGLQYAFTDLNWEKFLPVIGGILILLITRAFLLWVHEVFGKYAAGKVKESIRVNLFRHFFLLGPGYMEEGRTGKLLSVFIDGVEALEVFLVEYIPQVVVTVGGLLFMISYIFTLDSVVGFIILLAVIVCVTCPMVWDKLMNKIGADHWESYGDLNSQFVDAMQGMSTLKAFNASNRMGNTLEKEAENLYVHTMEKLKISLLSSACVGFASTVGTSLSIGIGALHLSQGVITMGSLSVILFLTTECFRPVTELNRYWHNSFLGFSAAEKMFEFTDTPVTVVDKKGGDTPVWTGNNPDIAFENVTFSYPSAEVPALRNYSMYIPAGSCAALAGKSGAGKSTVVNLLLRFFEEQEGGILLNGTDIREIPISFLRKQIAVVFQDTYLFYGTVMENLLIAKPDAVREEVIRACRMANAHDFIAALPDGYDTIVGERGTRLSGGERQRLSIARAILKDAPVLVLDEATSNVDAANEQMIQESLESLMKGRTTLIIAHRLSTVIHADEIFVLGANGLEEHGTAEELMQKDGLFMNLMKAQQSGEGRD